MDINKRLAVLIDADNESHRSIDAILSEVAKYGVTTSKRIYGDWSSGHLSGWREKLLDKAITPVQQFANTKGKNSTDSALIIDAMDMLHSQRFDGFCIVSSDSDFTRLITRIREQGLLAIGVGRAQTPKALIAACDRFITIENLEAQLAEAARDACDTSDDKHSLAKPKPMSGAQLRMKADLVSLLRDSWDEVADEEGWANLGRLGQVVAKRAPEFDSRTYGYAKWKNFVEATGLFEFDARKTSGGSAIHFARRLPSRSKPGKASPRAEN